MYIYTYIHIHMSLYLFEHIWAYMSLKSHILHCSLGTHNNQTIKTNPPPSPRHQVLIDDTANYSSTCALGKRGCTQAQLQIHMTSTALFNFPAAFSTGSKRGLTTNGVSQAPAFAHGLFVDRVSREFAEKRVLRSTNQAHVELAAIPSSPTEPWFVRTLTSRPQRPQLAGPVSVATSPKQVPSCSGSLVG